MTKGLNKHNKKGCHNNATTQNKPYYTLKQILINPRLQLI